MSTRTGSGNLYRIMSSYMDGATGINIGDTLYLKHAVASPITGNEPEPEVGPYEVSPSFPWVTSGSNTALVTKRDGTNFTDVEVANVLFTINGSVITPSAGSSIVWSVEGTQVLEVTRAEWGSSIEVVMLAEGYNVTAIAQA